MTTPEPTASQLIARAARIDTLVIDIGPLIVPAFGGKKGYWTDYEAVERDGLDRITVRPRVIGRDLGDGYAAIDVDCHFDPATFPKERYNIVYGDGQFEDAVSDMVKSILGVPQLPDIHYTEAGMQGDDFISMEVADDWIAQFSALTDRDLTALTRVPVIEMITLGNFSWTRKGAGSAAA